ncbi:MAG: S49 family peptidase [Alphaproteobacteria bacterium]|nr:S49 family peptidase [Alphaproteobacteria bacterium]
MFSFIKNLFGKPAPTVPVLRLTGMIAVSSGTRRGLSLAALSPSIDKAFNTKGAKAVALAINSPGGSPVQSALIFERIRHLSREKNIPVISFVEDVAASGGYWLACAGDEIYANGASVIGSIGVVSAGFGFEGAIEKLGITRRVYTPGEKKVMLDPFQPENQEDIDRLKDLQRDIHEQFVAMVKSRRGSKLTETDKELFSGAFWTGGKSVELGLIDHLGELRQTLKSRFGDKVVIKLIEPKRSMLGLSSSSNGVTARLAEHSIDHMIAVMDEKSARSRFGL